MKLNRKMTRTLIKESGIKYCKIAELLGIERTTLYKKIEGDRQITLQELEKLSEILGVSTEELVDEDDRS